MISRLGLIISRAFQRTCPDPFVIAILLSLLTAVLALVFGDFPKLESGGSRCLALLDSWRAEDGIWKFLGFSMQMCLILVTGHALAATRVVRSFIQRIARMPRTPAAAVALVGAIAALAGVLHWGLALIVGAFMARDVGRSMNARGVRVHYPLLAAAGYIGLMVWHGGFSGSAPFSVTTTEQALKVLKPEYVAMLGDGGIPLTETVFSWMNLFITGGLVILAPIVIALLTPGRDEDVRTIELYGMDASAPAAETPGLAAAAGTTAAGDQDDQPIAESVPDKLNRFWLVSWALAIPLLMAFARYVWVKGDAGDAVGAGATTRAVLNGFASLSLNEINVIFLAAGLLLHGSPVSYMRAVEDGARGAAGIIIQFPLYAGIMAMMSVSGLVGQIAMWFVKYGNETTIPLMSFLSAAIVNLFVPSGGGQWGIQGPIALEAALNSGVEPGAMVMSVAYGDQITNMLQPFWALPLLAITGVRARDIVGYSAVVMVFGMLWTALGLLVF